MDLKNVLLDLDQSVLSVTVNRPEKLNALNRQTLEDLSIAFAEAAANESVRVVVLRGAGDKAFVAGADIGEIQSLDPISARDFSRIGQELMLSIEQLGKPVVAAIQGFALGGGCELAMACTLRVASEKARFGQPEINLGLLPGFGGTQRLARLAGRGAALDLCLTGGMIDAPRAFDLGLVTRVVPAAELDEAVEGLAAQLARCAPQALRANMDAIGRGMEMPLEQGLDYESQLFAVCCSTEDMREGTGAFLDKRKAAFTGR